MQLLTLLAFAGLALAETTELASRFETCHHPVVRKEWRDMSKKEQKSFIDAAKVCQFSVVSVSFSFTLRELMLVTRNYLQCLGSDVPASPSFWKIGWGGNVVGVKPASERTLWDDFTYS